MTETLRPAFPAPIRTVEGITEYQLSNGLTVLLFPDPSAQNITVNVTYLVGSRHEGRGEAGMAHLLEHMLFKGTPDHPNIKAAMQDRGAFYNASTWYDRTNYFATLAASDDNLEFVLKLEADRMINSWINQADLDTEMTVVRNEFEMGENDPMHVLHDQMFAAAFQWHNYGKTTIGNRSDIERVAVKNLKVFYQHYYQPDNAVLIIAGKFDTPQTQQWVLKYFGNIPKPNRILDQTYTEEPAQDGKREVTLLRAGEIAHAALVYHIPAASHPDYAALLVLAEVLGNEPSGLLFQSLVQSGMATQLSIAAFALKEPGMFLASIRPARNDEVHDVLNKMLTQLESLTETQITTASVERAKARILKHYKMVIRNSSDLALQLSESIAQGDYRLFFYIRDQVKMINADDVLRVATSYFVESNRTSGVFLPTPTPIRAVIPPAPDIACLLEGYNGSEQIHLGETFAATPENIDMHTQRKILAGTIKTSLLIKATRDQVNRARFIFRFGNEAILTGKESILHLIPNVLRRGSQKLSLQQVQDKLDSLQSTLKIFPTSPGIVMADINSDTQHLAEVISILSDLMQTPRFSEEEFTIVHQREMAEVLKSRTDPIQIGMRELERLRNPFPIGNIHYTLTIDETVAELNASTLEKTKQLYHELYGANHLDMAIVGQFDPNEIYAVVEKQFASWHSPATYQIINKPAVDALSETRTIITPDKQMAFIAMGVNFSMRDDDINYPAIRMANYIFGESMKSRLMQRLREKEGLSYDAGSSLSVSRHHFAAGITLHALSATDKAEVTLAAMQQEYHRFIEQGVTDQELNEGKQSYQHYFSNALANDKFILNTLASMIDVNRTFAYYAELIEKINQLTIDDIHKALQICLYKKPIAIVKAGDFKT